MLLPAGREIDFIIETASRQKSKQAHVIAIEIKRSEKWDRQWEKSMLALQEEKGVEVDALYGVYCGSRAYQFGKVKVLPVNDFLRMLFAGKIF